MHLPVTGQNLWENCQWIKRLEFYKRNYASLLVSRLTLSSYSKLSALPYTSNYHFPVYSLVSNTRITSKKLQQIKGGRDITNQVSCSTFLHFKIPWTLRLMIVFYDITMTILTTIIDCWPSCQCVVRHMLLDYSIQIFRLFLGIVDANTVFLNSWIVFIIKNIGQLEVLITIPRYPIIFLRRFLYKVNEELQNI